jgi:hypothetical protein
MNRGTAALGIALVTTGIILAVALLIPIEIRHTAPFGFRQTLDRSRGLAVNGVTVTSNYANFNRIDLDLRAYTEQERYDFIVRIRPLTEDAVRRDCGQQGGACRSFFDRPFRSYR